LCLAFALGFKQIEFDANGHKLISKLLYSTYHS